MSDKTLPEAAPVTPSCSTNPKHSPMWRLLSLGCLGGRTMGSPLCTPQRRWRRCRRKIEPWLDFTTSHRGHCCRVPQMSPRARCFCEPRRLVPQSPSPPEVFLKPGSVWGPFEEQPGGTGGLTPQERPCFLQWCTRCPGSTWD